jgi:hypothetical protein
MLQSLECSDFICIIYLGFGSKVGLEGKGVGKRLTSDLASVS